METKENILKVKLLKPDAIVPTKGTSNSAGYDIYAYSDATKEMDQKGFLLKYKTEIAVEIPQGYVGLIFPRSSISNTPLSLANSVGVIDSDYRGEIIFKFRDHSSGFSPRLVYKKGDRIGQLVIVPNPDFKIELAEELSETERGEGGFGSTGK